MKLGNFFGVVGLLCVYDLENGRSDLGPDVAQRTIGLEALDDQVLKLVELLHNQLSIFKC